MFVLLYLLALGCVLHMSRMNIGANLNMLQIEHKRSIMTASKGNLSGRRSLESTTLPPIDKNRGGIGHQTATAALNGGDKAGGNGFINEEM